MERLVQEVQHRRATLRSASGRKKRFGPRSIAIFSDFPRRDAGRKGPLSEKAARRLLFGIPEGAGILESAIEGSHNILGFSVVRSVTFPRGLAPMLFS